MTTETYEEAIRKLRRRYDSLTGPRLTDKELQRRRPVVKYQTTESPPLPEPSPPVNNDFSWWSVVSS